MLIQNLYTGVCTLHYHMVLGQLLVYLLKMRNGFTVAKGLPSGGWKQNDTGVLQLQTSELAKLMILYKLGRAHFKSVFPIKR